MKSCATALCVAVFASFAVAAQKTYDKATIVEVEEKAHTRVLYYLVNTPVTADDPYYDITIQGKDVVYTAEYTPRHSADTLPAWKPGDAVEVRVEKRHMFMKSPDGSVLDTIIVKRAAASSAK